MSWGALASNQIVSDTNLANAVATGVFSAKTSIPSTGRELTATSASNYAYVNTGGRASNQLVTKGSLSISSSGPGPYNAFVYAVTPNVGYVSSNGGFTFIPFNALPTGGNYNSIAGDTSVTNIAIGSSLSDNYFYTSNNSGSTFNPTTISNVGGGYTFTSFYILDIAMSDNGQYVAIVGKNAYGTSLGNITVAISSNYGVSFTAYYSYYSGTGTNASVSVSGDGSHITYVAYSTSTNNSWRYVSTNYGSSFSYGGLSTNQIFTDVAISGSGTYQIIVNKGTSSTGNIFVSNNGGASFSSRTNLGGGLYAGMSNDGSNIVVCTSDAAWASTDYGVSYYNIGSSITGILGASTGNSTTSFSSPYLAAFQYNVCNYWNTYSISSPYTQPLSYGMYNPEIIQKVYKRAFMY